MITSIPEIEIQQTLFKQLDNLFGINNKEKSLIINEWGGVFKKLEFCFSQNPNKYYHIEEETYFNPFHSAQYTIFLYLMSRQIFLNTLNSILADKIYYLNKSLNCCDLFYEIELPGFFKCDHPMGTVLGRAKYEEGFSFSQCCTVGNNHGIYPSIGKNVNLCANSYIIGDCKIGDNVTIAAYSGVKDCIVPANTIVFGNFPNNIFRYK